MDKTGVAKNFAEAIVNYMGRQIIQNKDDFRSKMGDAAKTKILVLGTALRVRYDPSQSSINGHVEKILAKINDDLTWIT